MKKTIWKFQLQIAGVQEIKMPIGSQILSVQTQHDTPCLWAIVDPESEKETRHFEIFGTGHPIHYDMGITRNYIGTFQIENGNLVFHVFENIT